MARRTVLHGMGFVATAGLIAGSLAGAPAAAATTAVTAVPPPEAPAAAPAVIEEFAPYLPQVTCDPVAKPGTLSLRSTMMQAFGGRDLGITRS